MKERNNVEDLIEEIKIILKNKEIDFEDKIIERTLSMTLDYLGVNEQSVFDYYNYYTILDCIVEIISSKSVVDSIGNIKSHSTGNTSVTFNDVKTITSDFNIYPALRWW